MCLFRLYVLFHIYWYCVRNWMKREGRGRTMNYAIWYMVAVVSNLFIFWFVCLCNLVTFIYESLSSVVHTGRPVLALSRHLCIIDVVFFGKIESSSVNCFISVLYLFSLIWLFIIFYRVSFARKVKSWTKWVEASAQKTRKQLRVRQLYAQCQI